MYDTIFSLVTRFFAKTGDWNPKCALKFPTQNSNQGVGFRSITMRLSAHLQGLLKQKRRQNPVLAKNRITRENTVRNSNFYMPCFVIVLRHNL